MIIYRHIISHVIIKELRTALTKMHSQRVNELSEWRIHRSRNFLSSLLKCDCQLKGRRSYLPPHSLFWILILHPHLPNLAHHSNLHTFNHITSGKYQLAPSHISEHPLLLDISHALEQLDYYLGSSCRRTVSRLQHHLRTQIFWDLSNGEDEQLGQVQLHCKILHGGN